MTRDEASRRWGGDAATRRAALGAVAAVLAAFVAVPASAAEEPVTGGTLVYLEQQAHTNLYPPAGGFYPNGGILNQITDKLTYQNPKTLEIEPWIAKSWTVDADATAYTFEIREGVTFSDGTPVDAAAVAKNFDTFGLGNKDLKLPVSEAINNYARSAVLGPLTVRFHFTKPSPGFLQATSVIGSGLVAPKTLALPFDQLGDATRIVGSGPFVIVRETLGREIQFAARKDYAWGPPQSSHGGRAYLDGIKLIVTPEDSVRIGALLAGQAHIIRQIQAYDEREVEAKGFPISAPSTRGVNNSIAFRPDNPLVADLRVRRALTLATDTREIVDTLYSEHYPRATSVIAATATGYRDLSAKLAPDAVAARRLLDEAGWRVGPDGIRRKDGRELALTAYESLPQPQNKDMLQLVAQQWAKVGVKLSVLAGDSGSRTLDMLDPLKTGVAPVMVGRADPDVIKSQFYPKNRDALLQKGGSSTKVQAFVDERLNGLFDAIAGEPDRAKRLQLVGEVQEYLLDQAYVIPIFEEPQAFAASPLVKGLAFEAVGRPSFYGTWLTRP
ncbi:TIGR04028 family ABC transporter substrate-binding protein [Methylobacterium sp. E-066]|uniref:TIGR04028 family ABC transporter substrate-binding protein n=1 Tax=Methylobacterium sp. E-066 TaxID=2836584 RepID=UPI001FBAEA3D|nr:TIGR04028 family ABC transporter substrate-binding protein [Methylobacterium sp. E-066]MCJ2144442.1 TIGR04028 family ABC transporter substrate-binding protein [Methylobacterium sp. E-066]